MIDSTPLGSPRTAGDVGTFGSKNTPASVLPNQEHREHKRDALENLEQ